MNICSCSIFCPTSILGNPPGKLICFFCIYQLCKKVPQPIYPVSPYLVLEIKILTHHKEEELLSMFPLKHGWIKKVKLGKIYQGSYRAAEYFIE